MQFAIIIQARLGSKRLPGKVLKEFKGYNILNVLISRLRKSKNVKNIIIAKVIALIVNVVLSLSIYICCMQKNIV